MKSIDKHEDWVEVNITNPPYPRMERSFVRDLKISLKEIGFKRSVDDKDVMIKDNVGASIMNIGDDPEHGEPINVRFYEL